MSRPNWRTLCGCSLIALLAVGCRTNPLFGEGSGHGSATDSGVAPGNDAPKGSGGGHDGGKPPGYRPTAVSFHSADNTYLTTGQLTGAGNVSQQKGTFSVWLRFTANDSKQQQIVEVTNVGRNQQVFIAGITRQANNTLNFDLTDCLGGEVVNMSTNATYTTENGWVHVLASWDTSAGSASIFVNGLEDTYVNTVTNAGICYGALQWGIGGLNSGLLDADVADLYATFGTYLDIGSPEARQSFTQDSKPVDIGEDCSKPTGARPIACFHGPLGSWNVNLGTGGGMNVGNNSGALTAAATGPGD
jgi:hypothetical protein